MNKLEKDRTRKLIKYRRDRGIPLDAPYYSSKRTFDLNLAMSLRDQGLTWPEIARRVGAKTVTVSTTTRYNMEKRDFARQYGVVAKTAKAPDLHSGNRGFESRPPYQASSGASQAVRQEPAKLSVPGSTPGRRSNHPWRRYGSFGKGSSGNVAELG